MGEDCRPFSISEMLAAINLMKGRGAPGPDKIAPQFLKKLGPTAQHLLIRLFNWSWRRGRCPQAWRNSDIIPILKKGKPAGEINSYRPVSLTSCVVKVFERMIAARLQHLAESNNWLADQQAGFRALHSCEDQVIRLSQSVSDAFQQKPMQRTVLALLDFSKAFDQVWRDRLLLQLVQIGTPLQFVRWIRGFLCCRTGRVKINGTPGKVVRFNDGVPQGSVLSPLLFLIAANSVASCSGDCHMSLYADDVAIWSSSRSLPDACQRVAASTERVFEWSKEMKLTLNVEKCEATFFSTDTHEASFVPTVIVQGHSLPFNASPRFLGVTFDRTLFFRAHIDRIIAVLANKEWGWKTQQLRAVHLAIIRSVLTYAAAGWVPWISESGMQQIQRAENRAL